MDVRPTKRGSVAGFRALLSDTDETVDTGVVRALAVVIVTTSGSVYTRVEAPDDDDVSKLAIKAALMAAG